MELLRNIRSGIRLACFQRVSPEDFRPSLDQLFLLVLLNTCLALVCGYLTTEPPRYFDGQAIGFHAVWISLTLLLAYGAARESDRSDRSLLAAVMLLSPLFLWWIIFMGARLAGARWPFLARLTGDRMLFLLFALWLAPLATRAVHLACRLETLRSAALVGVYLIALPVAFHQLPAWQFWWSGISSAEWDAEEESLNVEEVLYEQHQLVEQAAAGLLPSRPGVTDLYFVGFGADATQDVFMREIRFARDLFDRRFDTRGRSVALINNDETLGAAPLASATNLATTLRRVAAAMDVDEDVLFLFLTSHGSRDHELVVNFPPLPLNSINPEQLAAMLEDAGIRWRVIVVSGCYSGGFIDALRSEAALVLTASAADRSSFGCSNEAEFTYFGRAFFKEQLATEVSFLTAFEKAREQLRAWEENEGKTPSRPQSASSAAILERLHTLEARLDGQDAPAGPDALSAL